VSVQELYYHHRWYWQKLYFHAWHFIVLCVLCESNHFFTLKTVSSLPLSMAPPFVFSHCPSLQSKFSWHWLSRSGLVCELSRYTVYFSYRGGSGSSTILHVVGSCMNVSQYCVVAPMYIIQFCTYPVLLSWTLHIMIPSCVDFKGMKTDLPFHPSTYLSTVILLYDI